MRAVAIILSRNLVRLALTFLAVALVTWLLLWSTRPPQSSFIEDCAMKDAKGSWQFVSCDWVMKRVPGTP
jgi:hypothetical protein